MLEYEKIKTQLEKNPKTWLITGVAGFIGSNLLEKLLKLGQHVVGFDNFASGFKKNLDEVKDSLDKEQWSNFSFIKGDIRKIEDCHLACKNVELVLHQAALGSVPRSINDPIYTNDSNISGFLNILVAARDANVSRFIYAASSSTYGDHPDLPKMEDNIGKLLSPYAVTKLVNELYAEVFSKIYGIQTMGLRYFNVFGPRQNPNGSYAAVIPKWIAALISGKKVFINGNGTTSRDFCYIDNVVQANILAATTTNSKALNKVFNVAIGESTTLNELFKEIKKQLAIHFLHFSETTAIHQDFRTGDVLHSLADISRSKVLLGYKPSHRLKDGLIETLNWYIN